jgi:hypothetical protein
MDPGKHNIRLKKGAFFSFSFYVADTSDDSPIDTGAAGTAALGFDIDNPLLAFSVAVSGAPNYTITLTATPTQTVALNLGSVPWSYMDVTGEVWIEGICSVEFTPTKLAPVPGP